MGRIAKAKNINARWKANAQAIGEAMSASTVLDIRIEKLSGMAEALKDESARFDFVGRDADHTPDHIATQRKALFGDSVRLDKALEESGALIDSAILAEPRLAKRATWTRSEDGIFADAGLVASGDDSPCFDRRPAEISDTAADGEPVTVCISTDGAPRPKAAAAFIAVCRIVQQFRPLRVVWQGAWLADDGREAGYVFHAPLIENDLDFSRVDYVLSDETRDHLSFSVLIQRAYVRDRIYVKGLGRHATRAYIPGALFVDKDGIRPDGNTIARTACEWLGWETPGDRRWEAKKLATSAKQTIPKVYTDTRTPAEREAAEAQSAAYWKAAAESRKAREATEAEARLAGLSRV